MTKYTCGSCNLQQLLSIRGMTQTQLAHKLDMSKNQISDYATNRKQMNVNTLKTISVALGCRMEDLYNWNVKE